MRASTSASVTQPARYSLHRRRARRRVDGSLLRDELRHGVRCGRVNLDGIGAGRARGAIHGGIRCLLNPGGSCFTGHLHVGFLLTTRAWAAAAARSV